MKFGPKGGPAGLQRMADLVSDYEDGLVRANRRAKHIAVVKGMHERMLKLGGSKYFRDITADSMSRILDELERQGKTVSYRNKYIARAKALVRFYLPSDWPNPLAKLRRINERGAKRNRERRAASDDQLSLLFSIELPHYRKLSYALACYNGLRRNEVSGLKWERIHLQAAIPFVEVPQKMGDGTDSIPLHPFVVELLQERLAMPHAMVVPVVPDVSTLERDWKRAGVEMVDDKRRRLDFHALRHTFQTSLDRTGCSRATKKKLMRHAAEDVTDGYAHAELA